MATRLGRYYRENDVAANKTTAANGYKNLFAALFCNAAKVEGITDRTGHLTDDYILQVLYEYGAIAYDKSTGLWLPFYGQGTPNAYGVYEKIRLYSAYGQSGAGAVRNIGDVYIFDANALAFPISHFIAQKARTLAHYDLAIRQNLDAVKAMSVILTDNKNMSAQLRAADKKRREGASVAVVNKSATDGSVSELSTLTTGAEYIGDKLREDRRAEYEETLHILGIATPYEKAERLISDEVETQNAETNAYIGLLIDTFNRQAEEQGAPFRLVKKAIPAPKIEEEKEV
jgi:hypothetical protein